MAVNVSSPILVVEDHSDSRTLLSAWLRAKGYKVVEARNGKEGLLQANRVKPDLILIYRKPDAESLDLVRLGSHSELGL